MTSAARLGRTAQGGRGGLFQTGRFDELGAQALAATCSFIPVLSLSHGLF